MCSETMGMAGAAPYEHNPLRECALRAGVALARCHAETTLGQDTKRKLVGRMVTLARLSNKEDKDAAAEEATLIKALVAAT